MVLYPEDALQTFWDTDIDILVINNQMIFKNDQKNKTVDSKLETQA
jgi:hypothetical protein